MRRSRDSARTAAVALSVAVFAGPWVAAGTGATAWAALCKAVVVASPPALATVATVDDTAPVTASTGTGADVSVLAGGVLAGAAGAAVGAGVLVEAAPEAPSLPAPDTAVATVPVTSDAAFVRPVTGPAPRAVWAAAHAQTIADKWTVQRDQISNRRRPAPVIARSTPNLDQGNYFP